MCSSRWRIHLHCVYYTIYYMKPMLMQVFIVTTGSQYNLALNMHKFQHRLLLHMEADPEGLHPHVCWHQRSTIQNCLTSNNQAEAK